MIPAEINKELFITVESDELSVAVSPPVLDGIIVAGQAPSPDGATMYFAGYDPDNEVLTIQTYDGHVFTINNAKESVV